MDGRRRFGAMDWDLCENSKHSGKMLKSLSGVPVPTAAAPAAAYAHKQTTSLTMSSSYPQRDSITGEHSSRAATMNLSWIPERNYMTHPRCIDHPEENPASLQMMELPQSEDKMHTDNNDDARNQHPSGKKPGRRATGNASKPKEPPNKKQKKKLSSTSEKKAGSSSSAGRRERKDDQDGILMAIQLDLSSVPVPVCSCTGVPRQCYRWGSGGWQSSCCTMTLSEYPLPMSPSRPGVRRAGRKMSIGAYGKLLQRLAAEGCDLSCAVDLKDHWARHGTNKFVTIR